jgi:hypothetical protein
MSQCAFLLFALFLAVSCASESSGSPPDESVVTNPAVVPNDASAEGQPANEATVPVQKIVFVGKKKACECTQKRVDASWAALEAALVGRNVEVERINLDVDEIRTNELLALERFVAAPAIYFLNDTGHLVEMLQGEVPEKIFREALDGT